jgi:hypothetical protein
LTKDPQPEGGERKRERERERERERKTDTDTDICTQIHTKKEQKGNEKRTKR